MAGQNKKNKNTLPNNKMDPTLNRKQTIKIINWNCRGYQGKTSELKNIITKTDYPQVICLQETKMKEKQNEIKVPNYKEIHRQHVSEKGSPGLSANLTQKG